MVTIEGVSFPWWLFGSLILLALVSFGLLIAALVTIFTTPRERLTAPPLVWALISFVNIIGPIIFFVGGRKPAAAEWSAPGAAGPQSPAAGPQSPGVQAINELYKDGPA